MRYKIPIEIIELEHDNYHILVTSVFADGHSRKWVVDTGASKSIFDKNLLQYFEYVDGLTEDLHSAGIGDEPIQSEIALLKPFSFTSLNIREMKVAVIDLKHVNKLYASSAGFEICGLIGGDFLVKHKGTIDYCKKRMILRK